MEVGEHVIVSNSRQGLLVPPLVLAEGRIVAMSEDAQWCKVRPRWRLRCLWVRSYCLEKVKE